MDLNLNPVAPESTASKGEKFTEKEKAIAKKSVISVIKKRGGVPTLENGNPSLGEFVTAIKAACEKAGEIPKTYKDKNETRPYASYRHLANSALNSLRKELESKEQPAETEAEAS